MNWTVYGLFQPALFRLFFSRTRESATVTHLDMRVAYNNAYRQVLIVKSDSVSNMFVNNQVERSDAHNRHLIHRRRSRKLNSDDSIVTCLNDCLYIRGRYMCISWQKSLYMLWNDHEFSVFYAFDGNLWYKCVYFTMAYLYVYLWDETWNKVLLLLLTSCMRHFIVLFSLAYSRSSL